ncbi:MAG TPA: hypothetical protein ENN65_04420, partial [Candidatus Hydrogenedentes bacterium]|nr:hypothetical protein [Candidatus Hydrogenedentota bacterium]
SLWRVSRSNSFSWALSTANVSLWRATSSFSFSTRHKELAEAEYRQYRENREQARITAAMTMDNVSNVSVVQPASKPLLPVKPRKIRIISLGLLLGLFGGICLAFVCEYFDDSLNTTEAVEKRLGVQVLASISEKEFRACT